MTKLKFTDYQKQRIKEMKEEDEYKDLDIKDKQKIIGEEWTKINEYTELDIEEEKEETKEPTPKEELLEEDNETKYRYKCECGYYFNDPIPAKCPKCGCDLL